MTEELIKFKEFDNDRALKFFEAVQKIYQLKKLQAVRIRVYLDGDIVFQKIPTGKKTDEWLNRKQFIVMASGHSSLYVFDHQDEFPWLRHNPQVIMTGGGYPIYVGKELRGCFVVSGLDHRDDHQLIVNAIKEMEQKR
ncbi:uncharacterized protein (UPF0303 family) [Lactobacillus colini]|uniref:Uncharacterized protein (UPF0303 family) n=1 Tax=Lactobacillus colini TaxID=1819254 RepID=A0ABS4MFL7_9LACO|nr:heme-binding protein [Lactobacillus colini]MBP2058454.1 uncharacterized protein (UPF0303 family) [Lactobacillus colini]